MSPYFTHTHNRIIINIAVIWEVNLFMTFITISAFLIVFQNKCGQTRFCSQGLLSSESILLVCLLYEQVCFLSHLKPCSVSLPPAQPST